MTVTTKLAGTEKQISWAEGIRKEKLADCAPFIESFEGNPEQGTSEQRAKFQAGLDSVFSQTSAKWWIENVDLSGRQLLAQATEPII